MYLRVPISKMAIEEIKEYLSSLRYLILISFLVFIFSFFNGYFLAQGDPEQGRLLSEIIKEKYQPIPEMSSLQQFIFVVLNNSLILTFCLLLGVIFGIFPFLVLFSHGSVLGILASFSAQNLSWAEFFIVIMPHGIIEIPVLILAGAIGFKLGKATFLKIFKKEGEIKKELFAGFKFFLKVLLPLLVLAAFIEIFITAKLL